MNLNERIETFVKFGRFLSGLKDKNSNFMKEELEILNIKIKSVEQNNNWFTRENILTSLTNLSTQLSVDNFDAWLTPYNLNNTESNKKVLLVMAGNIPLVGFHDFISVLITGHRVVVKLSSNDNVLFPYLWKVICKINPKFSDKLDKIQEIKNKKFDAVIATGTDNSSRYFDYYFKNIRRIIRKNRSSIAIITGKESDLELKGLAEDIFLYFGLGCRNVSKIFIPRGYNLDRLFDVFFSFKEIINHKKYGNNYDYNKAVFLMGGHKIFENGFLLMKEDKLLKSPVSTLFYEYYEDLNHIKGYISENTDLLQCVVCSEGLIENHVHFGETQKPKLWNYSDNVDTIEFLMSI